MSREAPQGRATLPHASVRPGIVPSAAAQRPLLLVLSHLRWDFVFQRPQHLMSRAARAYEVLFVEEPIIAAPDTAAPRLELLRREPGITVAVPHLPPGLDAREATAAQRGLLDALLARHGVAPAAEGQPGRRRPLVAWFYTPMALAFAGHLAPDVTVYDCMDELSAFRGAPPEMVERERHLLARADLVFTGGRSLYEAKQSRHPRVFCFPSSIDAAHFARARTALEDPADQAPIGRPRLGFFGVVDERMDVDLVAALAEARPDWQFVMIGPVVKIDPAILPRRPNIHWLGPKKYAELPAYLAGWDLGFMPFAMNEHTRFISPTKTPEFLAAGLPLVSTPVTDVVRDWGDPGFVEIAADMPAMIARAEMLLARPREAWLARVDRRLATQSWDITWAAMEELIGQAPRLLRPVQEVPLLRPARGAPPPAAVAAPRGAAAASPARRTTALRRGADHA